MTESGRANDDRESAADTRRIGRRRFVRSATVLSAAALAAPGLTACGTAEATRWVAPATPTRPPAIAAVPEPATKPPVAAATAAPTKPPAASPTAASAASNPATLAEALKNRRSAGSFKAQDLPREKLMGLLWAAWGINRPGSAMRTAPSAMNAQETDLYVLLADGAYLYDARKNDLTRVSDQDLRATATTAAGLRAAPVHLIYVPDYARLTGVSQALKERWCAAHAGFIGQNVYLYCAAEGLGARFYGYIESNALKAPLKLRPEQAVIFGQAVGWAG